MGQKWVTVSQACLSYGASRRTLTRWIKQGKVESKLENNRRYVLVVDSETGALQGETQEGQVETEEGHHVSGMSQEVSQQELIEQLRSEVDFLRGELKSERENAEQAKERSDTIILQLTRQLEQSQRLLEYKSEPWYRRVFKRRREGE